MAHYALMTDDNRVAQVIVGRDEHELPEEIDSWESYYGELFGLRCLQTSYNTRNGIHYTDGEPSEDQSKAFRHNYASQGFVYNETLDVFVPPKPFPSWTLNPNDFRWEAPISYPNDGLVYSWDEASGDWVEVVEPSA